MKKLSLEFRSSKRWKESGSSRFNTKNPSRIPEFPKLSNKCGMVIKMSTREKQQQQQQQHCLQEKSKKKGKSGLFQPSSVNNPRFVKPQILNLPDCSMPALRGWVTGSRWDGQVRALIPHLLRSESHRCVSNNVTQGGTYILFRTTERRKCQKSDFL